MDEQQKAETNWSKIAAWVFGMWALMIPIGVSMVRVSVNELAAAQTQFQISFNSYVLNMERRMTLMEERLQVLSAAHINGNGRDK
jgi:hypothetical protein